MLPIKINNKYLAISINRNYKFAFFGLILIIYFAWMDIGLFVHLQRWSPPDITKNKNSNLNTELFEQASINTSLHGTSSKILKKYNHADPFTVYKPLSVKLIMIDHMTHYVHDILARFIEDTLHFTTFFPWVTANLVSFTGLFLALVGSRLILSDKILYCKIGAILFESRNLLDSLDGVVHRSKVRQEEYKQHLAIQNQIKNSLGPQVGVYQSNYGSSGYNVDYFCDGFGGLFFMLAIFIKFLKHLPHTNNVHKLLIKNSKTTFIHSNKESESNYIHDKLEKQDRSSPKSNSKYELLEMDSIVIGNDEELDSSDNTLLTRSHLEAAGAFATDEHHGQVLRHVSSRRVKLIVISFGMRLLFTGLLWDHFVHKYHDLLMVFSDNPNQRRMQAQAFKSISMWLIMWFWRLGNACAILEHLAITTFFNKLWEYIYFTSYVGWVYLIVLSLFTQMHYTELYDSIYSVSPS